MSKSQREKGKTYEREIVKAMRPLYPEARRGMQSRAGSDEADVEKTPWWIECKKRARAVSPVAALEQATLATDGRVPIAVCRVDRARESTVTMWLSDWLASNSPDNQGAGD